MERSRVGSGTEWESAVGYSRAVRAGDTVHVSGTTATDDDGDLVGAGDPYAQTARALSNVADALDALGADPSDVLRTRIFVADIEDWEAVGRAHREAFGDTCPATTMVQVERLVDPAMLVEIEAEARVGSGSGGGTGAETDGDVRAGGDGDVRAGGDGDTEGDRYSR